MTQQQVLQTTRLKAFRINDVNRNHIVELYGRAENIEFLQGIDVEKDIELTLQCYEKFAGIGAYVIFENESNSFVGFGGVQLQEPMSDGTLAMKDSDIEFVIVLDKKSAGKGYASEFCAAFFAKFFAQFPELKIPARVSEKNLSCQKLLKKFGFQHVGKTHYHNYGNQFDLLYLTSLTLRKK